MIIQSKHYAVDMNINFIIKNLKQVLLGGISRSKVMPGGQGEVT